MKILSLLQGIPFAPLLSDHFGRRATLFIGSVIMLVGVGVQTAANSVTMFITARVTSRSLYLENSFKSLSIQTVGIGLSMCINAAPLLLVELSYPTHRGKMASIYNSSWYIGSIISAWVCLF